MNELSNTMDLNSTLIRAEALFRRFRRLVDAVDKKGNFPAPRPLQNPKSPEARPASNEESEARQPLASGAPPNQGPAGHKGKAPAPRNGDAKAAQEDEQPISRVITPELRALLSRKVEVLPRKTVASKGDGLPVERRS